MGSDLITRLSDRIQKLFSKKVTKNDMKLFHYIKRIKY